MQIVLSELKRNKYEVKHALDLPIRNGREITINYKYSSFKDEKIYSKVLRYCETEEKAKNIIKEIRKSFFEGKKEFILD